jgi:hypothetical protein
MRAIAVWLALGCAATCAAARIEEHDVVVYGGTSAGVAAAVQVARMGKRVILIEPGRSLGGLSSGGLGATDIGNKAAVGGIAREFYGRVAQHYANEAAWVHETREEYLSRSPRGADPDTMWTFEPHVAEGIFQDLARAHRVPVVLGERLDRAQRPPTRLRHLTEIVMESGRVFRGRMFIDATYEGDLMAVARVSYAVGREPNALYGETLNGVQTARAVHHQFTVPVDPYFVAGESTSGLLPRVGDHDPGQDGQGDHRVQAYCFRMCLTDVPENRAAYRRPKGYDPRQYEVLLRYLTAAPTAATSHNVLMPNRKTDTNNNGAFSTDNIGMNYDYPDADYETRRRIIRDHERYQKGLMWFLANDPRVPKQAHDEASRWGLARDEFRRTDHWPHQLYIREARRMVGDYVMTEHDCRGAHIAEDPIALAAYTMDSHNVQRYGDAEGHVRNEGDVQVGGFAPYPISYGSIVPRHGECANLLVPVCLSASHIAYGSIRMEPVFMILGQSAATAAVQAIEEQEDIQDIDYPRLRERLLADKQVLAWSGPRPVRGLEAKALAGVVVDDEQATFTGAWATSTANGPFVEAGYRHDGNAGKGEKSARFEAALPSTGRYEVRLCYAPNANRATNVPVTIEHADGGATVLVNQQQAPAIDGAFVSLGTYGFTTDRPAVVIVGTADTDGHVIADAVQFVPVADP